MSAGKRPQPANSTQLWRSLTEVGATLVKSTKNFDRAYRYTLGERLMDRLLDLCDDWLLVFAASEYDSNPKEQAIQFKRDLYRFYAVLNITHILG